MRLDMFLNSSTKFKILSRLLLSNFKILIKKSQVGPFNHICLSLQYPHSFYASCRAAALRPVPFRGQHGGVGAI